MTTPTTPQEALAKTLAAADPYELPWMTLNEVTRRFWRLQAERTLDHLPASGFSITATEQVERLEPLLVEPELLAAARAFVEARGGERTAAEHRLRKAVAALSKPAEPSRE